MPAPKNGFQIRNLHPKKHVFKKKKFMYFCLSNTTVSIVAVNLILNNKNM